MRDRRGLAQSPRAHWVRLPRSVGLPDLCHGDDRYAVGRGFVQSPPWVSSGPDTPARCLVRADLWTGARNRAIDDPPRAGCSSSSCFAPSACRASSSSGTTPTSRSTPASPPEPQTRSRYSVGSKCKEIGACSDYLHPLPLHTYSFAEPTPRGRPSKFSSHRKGASPPHPIRVIRGPVIEHS